MYLNNLRECGLVGMIVGLSHYQTFRALKGPVGCKVWLERALFRHERTYDQGLEVQGPQG